LSSRCPFGDVNSDQNDKITIIFDALYNERNVGLSPGKNFLHCPLAVVQETNEFDDADL